MPPRRPRPDFDHVRDALRERDERAEEPEPQAPAEDDDERDDQEDDSGSG
jgi:hypothetical protein